MRTPSQLYKAKPEGENFYSSDTAYLTMIISIGLTTQTHTKKFCKGWIMQALYATPSWACYFFVEEGRCIRKINFGRGSIFFSFFGGGRRV